MFSSETEPPDMFHKNLVFIFSLLDLNLPSLFATSMPRESSAARERSHPYSAAACPSQALVDSPSTTSNQPEPNPASNETDYDSENEAWQDILDEATHDGCEFHFLRMYLEMASDGQSSFFRSYRVCWR